MNISIVKVLTITFLVLIWTPFIGQQFGWDRGLKINENRITQSLPTFSLNSILDYPDKFTTYYNDNFGFRGQLLTISHFISVQIFKSPPAKSEVTIGQDGWLFFTPTYVYLDTINAAPFTETELHTIGDNLSLINNHFKLLNARFYFLVAPNSQSIYPEKLPSSIKKVRVDSKLDQLTVFLNTNYPEIPFINPTTELVNAKKDGQLYYKHDTHWTQLGAFIAYQSLINRISQDFPKLSPLSLNNFNISQTPSKNQDLAVLLGASNFLNEDIPVFSPKVPFRARDLLTVCEDTYIKCAEVEKVTDDPMLPTLISYRDSYLTAVIPFLSEHFKQSLYFWQGIPYETEVIEKRRPNVIIYELTERELFRLPHKLFDFQK
jgi:alginate O-acetyltransferase complex protein AlgJ